MPQKTRYDHIIHPQSMVMSTIQVHKEHSQAINDISNLSVKTVNKISTKIIEIKRKNLLHSEAVLMNLITRAPHPNFRFFCPYCASLDVFITIDKTSNHLTVDCLDCKKRWIDSRAWKA
jgi:RNase P subunit RPR2